MFNKILSKYIAKTLLVYLSISLIVFTAILFMNQFVRIFNTAILLGADLYWIFYALSNLMPTVLALSIPMSWQLAVLMTLGTLSGRGEMIALRASGFSPRQIVFSIGICSVILCIFLMLVNNRVSPSGFKRFQSSKNMLAKSMSELKLRSNTFIDLNNWRMIAREIDPDSGKMKDITLFMYSKDNPELALLSVSAPQGRYKMQVAKGIELVLKNGEFQKADVKNPHRVIKAEYNKYEVFIPLYADVDFKNRNLSLSELTTPEILKTLKLKTLPKKRHSEYQIEVSSRLALALSPLIFFLVSAPLGFLHMRYSRAWAMVFTVVILFSYYGALMTGINIAKKFFVMSWFGPWLGNILGGGVSLFLWRRKILR